MSEAALASRLVAALGEAAAREAGASAPLVSVTIEVIDVNADAAIEARIVRRTRTLVFVSAECVSADGVRTAVASSVHKIV